MSASPVGRLTPSTYQYNKQLLRSAAFADCKILTADGERLPAHRNILSPRCEFFRCCFDGHFEEAATCTVSMCDDEPVAVKGLLYYLYTFDYPEKHLHALCLSSAESFHRLQWSIDDADSGIEDSEEGNFYEARPACSLELSQRPDLCWAYDFAMFNIADKYGLGQLREMATKILLKGVRNWKLRSSGQDTSSPENLPSFVSLIEMLYGNEAASLPLESLRRQVLTVLADFLVSYIRNTHVVILFRQYPFFAIDLVEIAAKRRTEMNLGPPSGEDSHDAPSRRRGHIPLNDESDSEN